jgi:hypothetical protein
MADKSRFFQRIDLRLGYGALTRPAHAAPRKVLQLMGSEEKPMENFQAENFLVSLFFSAIGFAYLTYGKKNSRVMFMVFGLLIMASGYFIESALTNFLISSALTIAPLLLKNRI